MSMRLTAKITATNRANAEALRLYPILAEIFAPLVGQKILKADGTLLEKYAKRLPAFVNTSGVRVWRLSSAYSLAWTVSVNEPDSPCTVTYCEATVYIGDLRGGILTAIARPPVLRTDYNAAEVARLRDDYKAKRAAADAAKSALYPFDEYDR